MGKQKQGSYSRVIVCTVEGITQPLVDDCHWQRRGGCECCFVYVAELT